MTIEERDNLKVGDRITVLKRPKEWQPVHPKIKDKTIGRGISKVDYPYTCTIKRINLEQSSPAFECENNYGWFIGKSCLGKNHLEYYQVSYIPKVGDWVTLVKNSTWTRSGAMDEFIDKTVKVTCVSEWLSIKFEGSTGWTFDSKSYRPATQEEIDKVTIITDELPETWYVRINDSPECKIFKDWYCDEEGYEYQFYNNYYGMNKGRPVDDNHASYGGKIFSPKDFVDKFINKSTDIFNELPEDWAVKLDNTPEWDIFKKWYGDNYTDSRYYSYNGAYYGYKEGRHECWSASNPDLPQMQYTAKEFVDKFINPTSTVIIDTGLSKYNTWVDNQKEGTAITSRYIPEKAFKETESKQKIIFNHTLILPTIKIVRRNQKIKF